MSGAPVRPGGDLPRLTSLRAFAALVVFMYHLNRDTSMGVGGITFLHGYVGVAFFFVLSGFVLTWSTSHSTAPSTFWWRRFARVYPSHFVMLLVALAVPVLAHPVTKPAVLANVMLVQSWFPQWDIAFGLNAVSWSLSCEAFFYLLTPFILRWTGHRRTRIVATVLLLWSSTMAVTAMVMVAHGLDIYAFTNPLVRSGEFAIGIVLATLATRGQLPRLPIWVPTLAVGVVWWFTKGHIHPQSLTGLAFAIAFAGVIWAAATADLARHGGLLRHRWLVYGGQISFCFYLVHELILLNGRGLWALAPGGMVGRVAGSMTALILCTVAAIGLHHLVERPTQRKLKSWIDRREATRRTAAA
ncbi:MAG: acyltransferase [Actinobacteria bacterium]|nr:acyltransferase [Actinomycetota bacterium]